jgi:cytochrome c-type biogenesis protein CcmE
VRKALATLPWVEQGSVQTDVGKREVRFNVNDKSAWSEDELRKSLKDQRFPEVTVKVAPKE